MKPQKATIEQIKEKAKLIRDNWAICEFTGDIESEVMIVQTLHACVKNHKDHGTAFSIKSPSVERGYTPMGGGIDNARGYRKLIDRGYIIEGGRDGETVIYPTTVLIDALDTHLAKGGER